jgi:glycosyltransferase involved in cell wall biosynthesis
MTAPLRQRVLICADWFTPGFKAGGPIRSLDAIVHGLANRFDFDVLTSDRDLGDAAAYPGITADTWLDRGPGLRVMYLSPAVQSRNRIGEIVRTSPWDCLYLNSMYSIPFTLHPLLAARNLGRRIVLAPRGMLHAGALKLKPLKKRIFLAAFRLSGLQRRVVFQATNAQEESDIRKVFGAAATIETAPNLPAPPQASVADLSKRPGELRIACVARVARNKNLLFLLERLASLSGDVSLSFYGPVEDAGYWSECLRAAKRLPAGVRFEPKGSISPDAVAAAIGQSHVFCLPTEGENFGHAIWEGLAAGRPVVISDRTPWHNLAASNAGWDLPLEKPDDWNATLTRLVTMDDATWRSHSAAAKAFAEAYVLTSDASHLTANLLKSR